MTLKTHTKGNGSLSLVMKKTEDNEVNNKKAIKVCEVLGKYGVNEPGDIKLNKDSYFVNSANIKNGKHNTENLIKLYNDLSEIEGLKVTSFIAETFSGIVKLVGGDLKEAKYEFTLGEYETL